MNKNPLNHGEITENFEGLGSVTAERVRARARELALIAGRETGHVTPADFEQAKRELTGGPSETAKDALIDSMPESQRWNPVPSSAGHQAPESGSEDEDDEGRSETEQLVERGVDEAEHDQMVQAARSAQKKDRAL